jgi:hypothetical protein
MSESRLAAAHRLLAQAVDALSEAIGSSSDAELVSVLTVCEGVARRLERVTVDAVAALEGRGVFTEKGYTSPVKALADLLGWEPFEARLRPGDGRRAGDPAGRARRLRSPGPPARHSRGTGRRTGEAAARRGDRPRAGHQGCEAVDATTS